MLVGNLFQKAKLIQKLQPHEKSKEMKITGMIKLSAQVNLFYLGVVKKFAGQTL
jgi:hypothetical protein